MADSQESRCTGGRRQTLIVDDEAINREQLALARKENHEELCAADGGEEGDLSFARLAKALSRDVESIYYVDVETGGYLHYRSDGAYSLLEAETGTDFFSDCQRDVQKAVYSEDWEKVASALDRDTLLAAIESRSSFSMDYRLVVEDKPTYYRMKAVPAETGAFRHIIVGVSNVDAQIADEQRLMAERQSLQSFSRIAQALAQDYFLIYYVDVETDYFIEFSAAGRFLEFGIEKRGEDFFKLSRRNVPRFTYKEDVPRLLDIFTKENVLREVDSNGSLSVTYRMIDGDGFKYVMMKATRMDARHIVIATSDIDAEVQRQKTAQVDSGIARALSSDYFLIFFVDTVTDRYLEYRASSGGKSMDVEQGGEDFFRASRELLLPNVSPEDLERVEPLLDKETILGILAESGSCTVDYQMRLNGAPTYVHMKASRMADREDHHIVIGLRNIDQRVRREQAQARALQRATELANLDALTGVKSKRVWVDTELIWDERIASGEATAFGIAVFDLNGLKEVNDNFGHKAGDEWIKSGCSAICDVFKRSPVFRIGGDEFAAILNGHDYEHRDELLRCFAADNAEREARGEVVVACGVSIFRPGEDNRFQDVFERADAAMYREKRQMKGSRD